MRIKLLPGRYVVAVSGGVDSVVLLDLLANAAQLADIKLIVAHFDHGIRIDSNLDRQFVEDLAQHYSFPFVFDVAELGNRASEDKARQARYEFLSKARQASAAQAIITAHHEDDVLETAILNLLRGTGRKGLTSLASQPILLRPLLGMQKRAILNYATLHGLSWREDSTNSNQDYKRNYIRNSVLSRFSAQEKADLLRIITLQRQLNQEIDGQIINFLHLQSQRNRLDRKMFNQLPHAVAKEVLAGWFRRHGIRDFDASTIERLTVQVKTARPGKSLSLIGKRTIAVGKDDLALTYQER